MKSKVIQLGPTQCAIERRVWHIRILHSHIFRMKETDTEENNLIINIIVVVIIYL